MPSALPSIGFRRVIHADVPMLHEWINRPHVAEWWDSPVTYAEVEEEFSPDLVDETSVQHFIALEAGRAIGFIQAYVAVKADGDWWPAETDPGVRGIDQFLAEAHALNRGLGTAMVRAFIAELFADQAVTKIQTDPRPTNARAIRCYEKSGFRRVGEVETPDGVALLMVCDRAGWETRAITSGE